MHVLCIICDDQWMSVNFSEGWRRLGATVEEFKYAVGVVRGNFSKQSSAEVKKINHQIIERAKALHDKGQLDLIFCSLLDDFVFPETLVELKKLKVPLVNYHADMVPLWFRSLKTAKYFDLFCCAQRYNMNKLAQTGAKVFYLPMASNPSIQQKILSKSQLASEVQFNGVCFLGAPIGYRPSILANIYFNGIPLRIYGHHWDWVKRNISSVGNTTTQQVYVNGIPFFSEKQLHDLYYYLLPRLKAEGAYIAALALSRFRHKFFAKKFDAEEFYAHIPPACINGHYAKTDFDYLVRSAAINIGFTHVAGNYGSRWEKKQIRLREFEIPMAGGFYITQYCDELPELYTIGKTIEAWKTKEELIEKVHYYLQHADERNEIAFNGYQYAINNHTWENRFRKILKELAVSV